ncbi:radical SAM protein [Clostridium estertheticum]|uniref:radical SAM protein n=1 Tax=Clostridium estertheticum TaxID=238834 RepID=UPI001C0B3622|nr:radical SAM protein [Clostridium estertheticum]MBU3198385.1 radical SAM protein [Clostridium estertheticum]WAG65068.1 radical SAM protein [Clostridium estertheticum]
MHYTGTIYRPPYEANTPLLQVTVGCTHNKCKFCSMYKDVKFKVSPMEEIEEDLVELREFNPNIKRIYLLNADPFVLSFEKLKAIILKIKEYLPKCESISMFSRISNIKSKTIDELKELRSLGITDLYTGPESGDDETLLMVNKNQTSNDIVEQCKKLEAAGIEYVVTFLNGLAGSKRSKMHAIETAKTYNQLKPTYTGTGGLTLFPETDLYKAAQTGEFDDSTELERIIELKTFLEHLNTDTYILSHHTSTAYIEGKFPENKQKMLDKLQHAIDNYDEAKHNHHRNSTHTL